MLKNKIQKNILVYTPFFILTLCIIASIYGFGLHQTKTAYTILQYTLIIFSIPLWIQIAKDIVKGNFGVDLIAGVALIASLAFGQYIPGVVVLLMLSGGQSLEGYAMRRARRELSALLNRMPTIAHKKVGDDIVDIAIEKIQVGDTIIIKAGETVPVDGVVISGNGMINESSITGESLPVEKHPGNAVVSGTSNEDGAFEVKTLKIASESRLAQIIKIVKQAEEDKAPLVRLADQYSVVFTVITFGMALIAWFVFGETSRVLGVLVVATPCPLILATPIAMISGISRAAKRGIIVKNGAALEHMARARSFVFDKTGTITLGVPHVLEIISKTDITADEVLRLSASLDQLSIHILARSLVDHAIKNKNLTLSYPTGFKEYFGDGVTGMIHEVQYYFGKLSFIQSQGIPITESVKKEYDFSRTAEQISVYLANKDGIVGIIHFADMLRNDSVHVFESLRTQHIQRIVMLTGDHPDVAEKVALAVGIQEFKAQCFPEDKLTYVKELQEKFSPLVMVGDGVNDAPALAQADVGIALGGGSDTVSSETADIVIVNPNLSRVLETFSIAKRTRTVALQGIWIGIGLSIICMIFSLFGYIDPIAGAIIQEGIDIIVILNALRVGMGDIL